MIQRPSRRGFWSIQYRSAPYVFVAPFVLLFFGFFFYPLAQSLVLSFYSFAGPRLNRPVGLGNYTFMLGDVVFWKAVVNTFLIASLYLLLLVPLSLGLAILLNSPRVRLRNLYRFAFFSSYTMGSVFVAILFTLLLAPRAGLINRAIGIVLPWIGSDIDWRSRPLLAVPALVIAALWLSIGQAMIYLLAALQAVDPQLYDAANVDGAGRWQRFRHVTLPAIAPVLTYLVLVGTIFSLQMFELPYLFFQYGFGPQGCGLTIVGYLYLQFLPAQDIGFASAVGWALVLLISIIALVQFKLAGTGQGET